MEISTPCYYWHNANVFRSDRVDMKNFIYCSQQGFRLSLSESLSTCTFRHIELVNIWLWLVQIIYLKR